MMESFSNYAYGEPVKKVVELRAQFLNDLAVSSLRVIPVLYRQHYFIPAYTGKSKLASTIKDCAILWLLYKYIYSASD